MKFELIRDPYMDNDFIFEKSDIEIKPGVTVLVGCNGSGKSSLLKQIIYRLKNAGIPFEKFDYKNDGGRKMREQFLFQDEIAAFATAISGSEGEEIVVNMMKIAAKLGSSFNRVSDSGGKEFWILLDAIDSGLSVDNILDIKEHLFDTIFKNSKDMEIYIVVSANSYEMCRQMNCFDVIKGEYVTFKDYEDYRNFIMETRKIKEKRCSYA